MKNRMIFAIAFLLITTSSFAQKVIDLGNVDFLEKTGSSIEMKFLKKHSETVYTEVLLQTNDGNITVTIDTISNKQLKYYYNLTPVKDMKPTSIAQWNALLKNKSYYMGRENGLNTFTTHNEHLMSFASYQPKDWREARGSLARYKFAYSQVDTKFCNYMYLKLQDDKYIVAAVEPSKDQNFSHIIELIAPYANSFKFLIQGKSFAYTAGYDGGESQNKHYVARLEAQHFFKKAPTINGKTQLISFLHQPTYIVGDSILFRTNNIFTFNDETKTSNVYTGLGEKLDLGVVRAVGFGGHPQLLVKNDLKYLEYNELSDEWPIEQMPAQIRFICGTSSHNKSKMINNGRQIQLEETHTGSNKSFITYVLSNAGAIDSIYFMHGAFSMRYINNDFGDTNYDVLYLKKKNGKFNIGSYELDIKQKTFTITELLTEDCDSLVMQYPTYFYKDGLMGCYPFVKSAKYKSVKLNDNFLRYKDTKNIEGWVDVDSLREYPDM